MSTCVIIVGFTADFPQLPSIEQPAWGGQTRAEHLLTGHFKGHLMITWLICCVHRLMTVAGGVQGEEG